MSVDLDADRPEPFVDAHDGLRAVAEEVVATAPLLGLAVGVIHKGIPLLIHGFGFADRQRQRRVEPSTTFEIGSLTKQFTATAILQLMDVGRLRLGDPVSRFLRGFRPAVTIEHLLHQTSGLTEYAVASNQGKTPDEIIALVSAAPPRTPPGMRWAYTNTNYFLLGRVVEAATGEPFESYVSRCVLRPAGLPSTTFEAPAPDRRTEGTFGIGGTLSEAPPLDMGFYGGAGALRSTVLDLLAWQRALFGTELLSPTSRALLTTPGRHADGSSTMYGSGFVIDKLWKLERLWHGGRSAAGFDGELAFYPSADLQVALLTNTLLTPPGVTPHRLSQRLARLALGFVPTDHKMQDAARSPFVGVYRSPATGVRVFAEDGHLNAEITSAVTRAGLLGARPSTEIVALLHQSDGHFVVRDNVDCEVYFDGGGGIVEIFRGDALPERLERVT